MPGQRPPDLLVFADDWGRHPSSCQHLISQLLGSERQRPKLDVCWVNTIGTRQPRLDLATFRRGMEKLGSWGRKPVPHAPSKPASPRVLSPRMWPSFDPAGRWLNAKLLARQLRPCAGPDTIIVTTIPIVADMVGRLPAKRWVYYCVDDFSVWPGLDGPRLADLERKLVAEVDVLITASDALQQRLGVLGRSASVLTHGVDLLAWSANADAHLALVDASRPRAVFWGLIDSRLRADWLVRLADAFEVRGAGEVVLVGPTQAPPAALLGHPRICLAGPMPYAELPAVGRAANVLIMPYADLPVTRQMQPLKLKEYLATGKPVVVSELPAVRAWADALDVTADADEFVARVLDRLDGSIPAEQSAARHRLVDESWTAKADAFLKMITS